MSLPVLLWLRTATSLSPTQALAWLHHRAFPPRRPVLGSNGRAFRSAAWGRLAACTCAMECGPSDANGTDRETRRVQELVERRYRFLEIERQLEQIDWSTRYVSNLWTYQLHYFDYSVDLARAIRFDRQVQLLPLFVDLWEAWLDAATSGEAAIEPYPTSVRCMNALRSVWLLDGLLTAAFVDRILGSVRDQLGWLSHHLERHLRANHLQKNLTALTWGELGLSRIGTRSAGRYRDELWAELFEQVLPDGGQFERSPMYHAEALVDFLRTVALCRAAEIEVPADVPERLCRMTRALQWLSRPDGGLHLFNDAANGERFDRERVIALARFVLARPFDEPSGVLDLPETGYFGHVDPVGAHRLIIDAGPPGPAYQPGHAHCDMLSFELDLRGRPVVVDAGVHGYDGDPYRDYVRSSRAHNTVGIDGLDQHEMWATFRVARRGEILQAADRPVDGAAYAFTGACRPYHDRKIRHQRSVELREGRLEVVDRVTGATGRRITSWLHLHPDYRLLRTPEGVVADPDGNGPRITIETPGADEIQLLRGEAEPLQGWYCPRFGIARSAPVVALRRTGDDSPFGWVLRWT